MGVDVNSRPFPFPKQAYSNIYANKALAERSGSPFEELRNQSRLVFDGIQTLFRNSIHITHRASRVKKTDDLSLRRGLSNFATALGSLHACIAVCQALENSPVDTVTWIQARE